MAFKREPCLVAIFQLHTADCVVKSKRNSGAAKGLLEIDAIA